MAGRLVVYDSFFGNTETIAKAIGEALENAQVINVSDVTEANLDDLEILFVGSPTRIFRASPSMMGFLRNLGNKSLSGVKAAVFDTRIPADQTDSGFLRTMVKFFGYADTKIAKVLRKKGAELVINNEGFAVSGTEGPLVEGELERSQDWARTILEK